MLVVPHKKKLVLDTERADEVMTAIPHAKQVAYQGRTLTAMEHGVEESLVLRNMGFREVPLPIEHYYKWPGRFSPMAHQRKTAAFLVAHKRALCLNSPGTGKSVSTLWAADHLLTEGVIDKVLIVAPLSTLKPVWAKELMHHFCHREFEIITGSRQRRVEKIKRFKGEFLIINHDGFSTMPEAFDGVGLVIYDEATALKSPSTQRYKKFAMFMNAYTPWLWMLTGTPISQNPTDAWTLAKLVGSTSVPRSYAAFKDLVMQRVTTFKWIPRPEALETCKRVLQPSIRFSLDECVDLPQTVYITRDCEMTKAQAAAYKTMQEQAVLAGQNISAANAAVLFQKLLQICCGVAYAEDGARVRFDDADRTATLREIIDEIGGKCIVFVPLRGVQDRLQEFLVGEGFDVASVHGDVDKADRDKIFTAFQDTTSIDILLAHPKVAAHGLTLTRASSIIWYAPIHSLESYEQANARIRRIGTGGKTVVYHIAATGFERELYRRLEHRQKVLADFLDLVQGVNEDV